MATTKNTGQWNQNSFNRHHRNAAAMRTKGMKMMTAVWTLIPGDASWQWKCNNQFEHRLHVAKVTGRRRSTFILAEKLMQRIACAQIKTLLYSTEMRRAQCSERRMKSDWDHTSEKLVVLYSKQSDSQTWNALEKDIDHRNSQTWE